MRNRRISALLPAVLALAPLLAGCATSFADVRSATSGADGPVTPSTIPPFYVPPDPLPSGSPGAVVRAEPLDVDGGTGWRVLYRSEGVDGAAVAVSGMVVRPNGDPPAGGWPIVTWAHGTAGSADLCAPSRVGTTTIPSLSSLVDAGYVVVATDYDGLGTPGPHPYLDGRSEGRAVLDAARAAEQLVPEATGDVVAWGYSQGGQAVLWAGELAPDYAPELHLAGIVAFAPAARLAGIFDASTSPDVGLTVAALAGLAVANPGLQLDDVLTPAAAARLGVLETTCVENLDKAFADVPGGVLRADPESLADWRAAIDANEAGEQPSAAPVLVAQGGDDLLVALGVPELYGQRACAQGTALAEIDYPGVDHNNIVKEASADALSFTADRLAGRPLDGTC